MIYYLYSSSTSRYVCAVSVQILLTSAQAFSGLSHQSHQLNATTLSDADSDQSPDAQQENCFSLGSCVQPSSPSALIWCFLSTAEYFDHNLLLSLSTPMWPEDT